MTETPTLEVVGVSPPTAIEAASRAEIDIQITTARRYPRSIDTFLKNARSLAVLDEDTAASCLYKRPVGKDRTTGQQTFAEGMSIRMAEIVASSYGNLRFGSMIIEQTERKVVARGFCHDLETNNAATVEVIEATVKTDGRPYDERMSVVVAKAALSKALRDAIFKIVPRALCKSIEEAARKVALGTQKPIEERRRAAMEWASKLGVSSDRVFGALSIKGLPDMGEEQLETLLGIRTAIRDNEISIEEAFPSTKPSMKDVVGGPK